MLNKFQCYFVSLCNVIENYVHVSHYIADDNSDSNGTSRTMTMPMTTPMTTPEAGDCGTLPVDIVFLVDESSSIGASNFQTQLDFLQNMVQRIMEKESDNVQLGLVTFSRTPENRFWLNQYQNVTDIVKHIASIQYGKSGTDIAEGMKFVRENSFTAANGARENATKILILMTDGRSASTTTEAQLMKASNVTVMVIAVGSNTDKPQLEEIVSRSDLLFEVSDFSALGTIVDSFFAAIPCPTVPVTTPPPTYCGTAPVDIVFLIDYSQSVRKRNFEDLRTFLLTMVRRIMGTPGADAQIGVVTFAADPENQFWLNQYNNEADMVRHIENITCCVYGTDIGPSLKYVRENSFSRANGARPEASKVLVLMTDGRSPNSSVEAKAMKDFGAMVLAVGVGSNVNEVQLGEIVSKPELLFTVSNFSSLSGIVDSFFRALPCPDGMYYSNS